MNPTSFKLEKLYMDCIDEDGNCFVVYWAYLKLSFLEFIYAGLIFSDSKGGGTEKSSFRKMPKPILHDLLHFNNPSLEIKGIWEKIDSPISLVLYSNPSGKNVSWNCHHPKTWTNILYKDKSYNGWGYAETLSLPVKPWHLPIDELRWGRYLSEKYTIIWIHWKGSYPVNKIICNGVLHEDALFEENRIVFDSGKSELRFEETSIIRKGKLSNVLTIMPWLKILFNSKILNTLEIKYKAKTCYNKDLNLIDKGWSLFEIVNLVK